jgi:peptide/nickel transport system substrate-binding protein
VTGTVWDLAAGEYPTLEDYFTETYEDYGGDPAAFSSAEDVNQVNFYPSVKSDFFNWSKENGGDFEMTVPNIQGIEKIDDRTVKVTIQGFDPVGQIGISISIAPLHYYGDTAQYDYANNKFGFPYGDLSIVRTKTTAPLGAGPYVFEKYENNVAYLHANPLYWDGEPPITNLQYKATITEDSVPGVYTGVIDMSNPSFSKTAVETIKEQNSNGEIVGDVLTTYNIDNNGYGYVGINAQIVNVDGEPGSEASINLRKAIATVVAAYRQLTVDSYYGEFGSVINYPISSVNRMAPTITDPGYRVAYSLDVDGNEIYQDGMTDDQKYDAALEAAAGYLIAAGYTFDEASGKFTEAPKGARLDYQFAITAQGSDDHPAFLCVTSAIAAFEKIGITLTLFNPSDFNEVFAQLQTGKGEVFFAAWGSGGPEPGLEQMYFSGNIPGNTGGSGTSNYQGIDDPDLDKLMPSIKQIRDFDARKAAYLQAFNTILDWATEIPIYQRTNPALVSTQRVDTSTVLPDLTPFLTFYDQLNTLETMAREVR